MIDNNLKWSNHVVHVSNKANKVLGCIGNTFRKLNINIMKVLYTSLVRPHLDYCSQVYSPYLKRDIAILENVQKRATKMAPQATKMPYEKRLEVYDLQTLSDRRRRGDLYMMYKLVHGYETVNFQKRINWLSSRTLVNEGRNHQYRLQKEIVKKCAVRYNFFTNRVVNDWNNLSPRTVSSKSKNIFKKNISSFEYWFIYL